ncbi:cell division ATP-binding protein FtsE [Candidatus Cyanaurora vandensis]|uniref:cell division ATP-binding protein FtsE n=1 Tax=Candidatus Cyanaurora vandensis TaxID=2714958 RepID=UPI0025804B7C|nr:cell division ATP-binding protein FtsE [Candidatus Cyanaurora vandensis]
MFNLLTPALPVPAAATTALVCLEGVSKTYANGVQGLKEVDLTVNRGEFLWISGVSGSGKSTLLKLLYGAEKPTAGRVWVDRQPVATLRSHALANLRRRIGVVFQDYKLLPRRTVAENITFVLKALAYGRPEIRRRLWPTLKIVGLESKADCFPEQLSGGEQQRVAIARAVVHTPLLLLADEPTGNLDPTSTAMVLEILHQLHTVGVAIIITTHDQTLLDRTAHRIIHLEQGRVVS